MSWNAVVNIFQGITTLAESFSTNPKIAVARIVLIFFGLLLIYLGKKGILEALLMIPMGLGMATVNAAIMFFDPLNLHGGMGTLFVEAQTGATADAVKNAAELMTVLQIDWLQPIYTYTFSNGLIACLVFMGIGAGYVLYFISRGKYNPAIGIAGVSCVPTTAKMAQKPVSKADKKIVILPEALGANVSGVITTAIIAGIYCSLFAK